MRGEALRPARGYQRSLPPLEPERDPVEPELPDCDCWPLRPDDAPIWLPLPACCCWPDRVDDDCVLP